MMENYLIPERPRKIGLQGNGLLRPFGSGSALPMPLACGGDGDACPVPEEANPETHEIEADAQGSEEYSVPPITVSPDQRAERYLSDWLRRFSRQ